MYPRCVRVDVGDGTYYRAALALGGGILLAAYWLDILPRFCL